ncbi:hypothetical protein [Sphingomonas zeicaulis]|uniref:hypothetical protein n=1 Tax=Sphingomonas zeicaulis TaxID=1632740 RepID=UPI003D1C1CB0
MEAIGHKKLPITDIYSIPDTANLRLALAVTETIIDEIEAPRPGAFSRLTAAFLHAGLRVTGETVGYQWSG